MLVVVLTVCIRAVYAVSASEFQLDPVISCYFQNGKPSVIYLEKKLCTHYHLIGSCTIDDHHRIILPNSTIVANFRKWFRFRFRYQQPILKLLITLTPENARMSYLVKNKELREALVFDVRRYLLDNELDGFDIDWEFPVWSRDAQPTDRKGFSMLIKELREHFDEARRGLLLNAAVAAPYTIVDKAYDVEQMNRYLDYVQIMNYDFHMYSKREPFTGFNAPLYQKSYEIGILGKMNSDYSTQHWLKKGLWANKTLFGIPTYGRGYTLLNKYLHFLYAPAVGDAIIGATYSFTKVCNLTVSEHYKYVFDRKARSAYIYGGDRQWMGLENQVTMFYKADYAKEHNLAGIMIYDLASDDYKDQCKLGTYPLIKAAKAGLSRQRTRADISEKGRS